MKKIISSALLALTVSATPTLAAGLDLILQNTVILTVNAGGQEVVSNLDYQADGSILVDGKSTGSWEEKDGKLCTTLAGGPDGQAQTACSDLADVSATQVGDTWTFAPAEGVSMQGELVSR